MCYAFFLFFFGAVCITTRLNPLEGKNLERERERERNVKGIEITNETRQVFDTKLLHRFFDRNTFLINSSIQVSISIT